MPKKDDENCYGKKHNVRFKEKVEVKEESIGPAPKMEKTILSRTDSTNVHLQGNSQKHVLHLLMKEIYVLKAAYKCDQWSSGESIIR